MDELAAAMGTSKSIVYRYFGDKAGLQTAVGEAVLEEMARAFIAAAEGAGPPRERLRAVVEIYISMLASSPNVYRFVIRLDQDGVISTFVTQVQRYLARLLREVLADAGADLRFATPWAAGVVGFVRGVGEQWLTTGTENRLEADALVDVITTWLWAGTGADLPVADRPGTDRRPAGVPDADQRAIRTGPDHPAPASRAHQSHRAHRPVLPPPPDIP